MPTNPQYLTPRKFLLCCGFEKKRCTEMTYATYLSQDFLQIPIYEDKGTFDTNCISQTELGTARYFLDPPVKRHSLSRIKARDICNALDNNLIESVVEQIQNRIHNPAVRHPAFNEIITNCDTFGWNIDPEARIDLETASNCTDAVRIMILLMASLFQDYYSSEGVHLKIKTYLTSSAPIVVREQTAPYYLKNTIIPVSDRYTEQTYVRREDLLNQISSVFSLQEKHGEKQILLLYGLAGEGKSELARAYAGESRGALYTREYWYTCPDGTEHYSLNDLCSRNTGEKPAFDILSDLYRADHNTLIIIDNCNTENSDFINELYSCTGDAAVILTTRLNTMIGFDKQNTIHVVSADPVSFSFEVFRKNYEKPCMNRAQLTIQPYEEDVIREICWSISFNTLFVSMIACFLREHHGSMSIQNFNRYLREGLLQAFPRYSHLTWKKDDGTVLNLEPLEVLEILFRELTGLGNEFSDAERQFLNLMVLFPAEKLSISFICSILGDNEHQILMENTLNRLLSLTLLQRQSDTVSIHPLLCELLKSDSSLTQNRSLLYDDQKKDAFCLHVLENLLLKSPKEILQNRNILLHIREAITDCPENIDLVLFSLLDKKKCISLLTSRKHGKNAAGILARLPKEQGCVYILQSLTESEKTELLIDLSERNVYGRYFEIEDQIQTHHKYRRMFHDQEADLLAFYQGSAESGDLPKGPLMIDLSHGIEGQPVYTIPDMFFRRTRRGFIVRFPETLRTVGDWAFDNCTGLTGQLILPDTVTAIGKGAFHHCTGLSGSLYLPQNLSYIGSLAFCYCTGLSGELNLPDSIQYMGTMSFASCIGLTGTVNCPASLRQTGIDIFRACKGLTPASEYRQISECIPENQENADKKIYIPPSVQSIEYGAYRGRDDLTGEIHLPVSLESIGDIAFFECRNISGNLKFTTSLQTIGEGAFYDCSLLSGDLDFPDTLLSVGDAAFCGCSGLNGLLRLSRSLETIPTACFYMCSNLTGTINLEELSRLKRIGEGAFFGCEKLFGDLYFPSSLEQIGEGAFDSCSGLTGLHFSRSRNLSVIRDGAFYHCKNMKGPLKIPNSVRYVGNWCFRGCSFSECYIYNPDCILGEIIVEQNIPIYGFPGSTAEKYAAKFGNPFFIMNL